MYWQNEASVTATMGMNRACPNSVGGIKRATVLASGDGDRTSNAPAHIKSPTNCHQAKSRVRLSPICTFSKITNPRVNATNNTH